MKISGLLRRERTNAVVKETVTFNAPGTYYPPYGKSNFTVTGQAGTGNPTSPGNTIPGNTIPGNAVPGNPVPGTPYPASGGNVAYYTTSTVYLYHDYWGGTYPGRGGFNSYSFTDFRGYGGITFPPWAQQAPDGSWGYWYMGYDGPYGSQQQTSAVNNPYYPAGTNPSYTNPTTFNPTNTNPTTYNPTVPGNPGTAGNVLGVYFPGGGSDSAAPVVGATPVSIDYTTGGISISVVPGGYISVINA
jgi:hypothetical protein